MFLRRLIDVRTGCFPGLVTQYCLVLLVLSTAAAIAAPVVVIDDLGRRITLSGPPERIVSLEPSVTEILYAVGAENRVVADDDYSDFPPAAKNKPHVNGAGPGRETMIGLRPDIILLYDQTFTRSKADQWQAEYGVPVYVLAGRTYVAIENEIKKIGLLAGSTTATSIVLQTMSKSLSSVQKAVKSRPKVSVFVVVWDQPLMTAGHGSYIDNLISLAGGIDVASRTVAGYPTYSPERLVADSPDCILTGTTGNQVLREIDPTLSALNLRANRTGRSYAIPDDWTSRPGPRLMLGLIAIAHVLHPESFPHPR